MFGYDEESLERARAAGEGPIDRNMFGYSADSLNRYRNRWPWWARSFIIGVEISILAAGLFMCFAFWLTTTPDGIRFALARIIGDAPIAIGLDDVFIHPSTDPFKPETWNIVVQNLKVRQTDRPEDGVTVTARWAVLPLPNVFTAWFRQELTFDRALAIGLAIEKDQNGVPRVVDWVPKKTALGAIDVANFEVWDGAFILDDIHSTSDAFVGPIYGKMQDVRYEPGPRLISGTAQLFAGAFRNGGLSLDNVDVTAVARDGNLIFDATSRTSGGTADIHGVISHLERRPAVELAVVCHSLALEQMVQSASGTASPITGRVHGTIEVRAGGDLPRGGAWMDAQLTLTRGRVPLRDRIGGFARDILRLVPWLEINDDEEMVLSETHAHVRFERGAAIIHELRYQTPTGRYISMRGVVDSEIDLVVRFEPTEHPELRAGFGFTIDGKPGALKFGIARRHDLLPSVFANEDGEKLDRAQRRERRRSIRQAGREPAPEVQP